ncbi:MAG: WYL domain-containing protein [Oscillospiraceae bacterium]|nr:WYL domain-containing protein [Oscillospiraceae bacterium]
MARSANQKLKLLHLARYLSRHSDEAHPVTVQQMIEYLERQDISAERKSLYDDMESLRLFGMDVQSVRMGSATGYFIGEREFQLPELKLLVDSVQSSKFITRKKSMELIRKLEQLVSEYEAGQLHRQVWVRGRIKTMNESIYYNVDEIHTAIEEDTAITFQYYEWNTRRERVFRRDGKRYAVSPWALMWDDENYYMVAFDHEAGLLKHFRVDKMSGIRRTKTRRHGAEAFEKLDMAEYSNTHFGMFSGEAQPVRLCFDNRLAGPVIDRFGAEAALVPYDGEHFTVTVNAAVNVQFFGWLCGFGDGVRILSPADAAERMRAHVEAIARLYGTDQI